MTVFHNERNFQQANELEDALKAHADRDFVLWKVDNREENRGFSKGCNYGAAMGHQPILGFLNPDVEIRGPFLGAVEQALEDPQVVITGERFGKCQSELRTWGVIDWVCGAAFFVRRKWFAQVGGFDTQFVWGWEETDLIRKAQDHGKITRSISLPIHHESPHEETPTDFAYKRKHFNEGADRFYRKWR